MVVVWGRLPNAAGPTLLSEERCGTAPACSSWGWAGQEVKVRSKRSGVQLGPCWAAARWPAGCKEHF